MLPRAARAGNDDELLVGNQAAMLGGALAIERPEHHGTRVVARIPWAGTGIAQ